MRSPLHRTGRNAACDRAPPRWKNALRQCARQEGGLCDRAQVESTPLPLLRLPSYPPNQLRWHEVYAPWGSLVPACCVIVPSRWHKLLRQGATGEVYCASGRHVASERHVTSGSLSVQRLPSYPPKQLPRRVTPFCKTGLDLVLRLRQCAITSSSIVEYGRCARAPVRRPCCLRAGVFASERQISARSNCRVPPECVRVPRVLCGLSAWRISFIMSTCSGCLPTIRRDGGVPIRVPAICCHRCFSTGAPGLRPLSMDRGFAWLAIRWSRQATSSMPGQRMSCTWISCSMSHFFTEPPYCAQQGSMCSVVWEAPQGCCPCIRRNCRAASPWPVLCSSSRNCRSPTTFLCPAWSGCRRLLLAVTLAGAPAHRGFGLLSWFPVSATSSRCRTNLRPRSRASALWRVPRERGAWTRERVLPRMALGTPSRIRRSCVFLYPACRSDVYPRWWQVYVRWLHNTLLEARARGPTDPTDPTDPSEPTEPTEPTEPAEPTEPTLPSLPLTHHTPNHYSLRGEGGLATWPRA